MKLKGKRTIVSLLAAITMVMGSLAGMALAGAEDRGGGYPYWWEDALDCYTPYEYEHWLGIEIVKLIMNRYFGIDVSRMTFEEMDEVGRLIGPEGQEQFHRLFKEYAQKKGFKVPELLHPEQPVVPPPVEDVYFYWWEVMNAEEVLEALFRRIAEAKGMSPGEVEARFGELFHGVDLWEMSFEDFSQFLVSLFRPPFRPVCYEGLWVLLRCPLRPVCFEELRLDPHIFALFGRVPAFSTQWEMMEFDEKLDQAMHKAWPLVREVLCGDEWQLIKVSRGVLTIYVRSDSLPRAEEVYEIIAEKAERLFGIEDVPVVFSNAPVTITRRLGGSLSNPASSGWRPPFNQPHCPIPGGVKVTSADWPGASTAGFAVRRWRWYWPSWDNDYLVTGHKGPGGTVTPVNMHVNQPLPPHAAGRVMDSIGRRAYAEAARVGISDARVRPYIVVDAPVIGPPHLLPVLAAGDPILGMEVNLTAGRSGAILRGEVRHRIIRVPGVEPGWGLYSQYLVRPRGGSPVDGDSGGPFWTRMSIIRHGVIRRGARICGLYVGCVTLGGVTYMVLSPVSGVEREFPGWRVWVRE